MQVEIWSDVACPWCYIGKRRFEKALARYDHADAVEVTWRSFELDSDAPRAQGELTVDRLMRKYGMSRDLAERNMARVTEAAAEEGLVYDLQRARSSNTFDAHRLVHLAVEQGRGDAMTERLMQAYQMEGLDVADRATLLDLATQVGLDPDAAADVLDGDRYAEAVRADELRARQLGVNGVPFFVFDGTTGISGAQPTEMFLKALNQLGPQVEPLVMMPADGQADDAACGEDGCAVPTPKAASDA